MHKPILESSTRHFLDELSAKKAPPIYTLTPEKARQVLEDIQRETQISPDVDIQDFDSFLLIRPKNCSQKLPIILYIHGAGWVMGSFNTHAHLVIELALQTKLAVVFVNYSRSPEVKFPVPLEESYKVLTHIVKNAAKYHLDAHKIAVCGDSVGGNMATALAILAKERNGPKIACQALLYPVTCASMNTASYKEFSEGPWLTKRAMEWFWDAYAPNREDRKNILLSPLDAPLEMLSHLPDALIITAQNDVLRDEGEEYAQKLILAKIEVQAMRMVGTIHDFMMLNALKNNSSTRCALQILATYLHSKLCAD